MNDLSLIIALFGIIVTIIIYKLQLQRNTSIRIKKKNRICNILIIVSISIMLYIIFIPKIILFFEKEKVNNNIIQNEEWEYTYKQFITNYYKYIKDTNNNFNNGECKFAIYDINKDGYPELFTYYNYLDSIYSYDSENNQMIKMSGYIAPQYAKLYASKTENELVISGWDSNLFRFSNTNFYMDDLFPQMIKKYSLVYCILVSGDVNEYGYYREYSTKTDEIDEETYNNDLARLLMDKNEIIFYKIDSIGNIEDIDLSTFITSVKYDD